MNCLRVLKSVTVSLLSVSLVFLSPAPVWANVISVGEMVQVEDQIANQLLGELEKPENIQKLDELGVSAEEAKQRIAGLSDSEIKDLLRQGGHQQAGGDAIVISLTTILLIVIIVLLLR